MSISEKNKEIYIRQASKYGEVNYWGYDEEILARKHFNKDKVLVLGCGGGRTLKPLYDLGFNVTGIDIVPEMVEQSKKRMAEYQVDVFEMDAARLLFENDTFDTIFFPFHGIDYVEPDIYSAVSEAARVLKRDGVFIFSSHNRLYIKKIHRFFSGRFDYYHRLKTYRTSPLDFFKLKKYFVNVEVVHKISLAKQDNLNWKDIIYRFFPWFSKTTYFICRNKK